MNRRLGCFMVMGLCVAPVLTAQHRRVQIHTRTLGWPVGQLVDSGATRVGLVLTGRSDTTWIPAAEIVAISDAPAPRPTAPVGPPPESPVPAGERVRLQLDPKSSRWLMGTMVTAGQDSLHVQFVDSLAPAAIARSRIRAMEVSRGQHSGAGKGALFGFITGATAGALLGAASSSSSDSFFSPGEGAVAGGFALGAVGALVGVIVGAGQHVDEWQPVSPGQVRMTIRPMGSGIAVAIAL